MLARVLSATVWGVDARLVEVEVDVASGLPTFSDSRSSRHCSTGSQRKSCAVRSKIAVFFFSWRQSKFG